MNGYRCVACDQTQTVDFSDWVCPLCGGNLDVVNSHDTILEQIRQSPFDTSVYRYRLGTPPSTLPNDWDGRSACATCSSRTTP